MSTWNYSKICFEEKGNITKTIVDYINYKPSKDRKIQKYIDNNREDIYQEYKKRLINNKDNDNTYIFDYSNGIAYKLAEELLLCKMIYFQKMDLLMIITQNGVYFNNSDYLDNDEIILGRIKKTYKSSFDVRIMTEIMEEYYKMSFNTIMEQFEERERRVRAINNIYDTFMQNYDNRYDNNTGICVFDIIPNQNTVCMVEEYIMSAVRKVDREHKRERR